MKYFRTWKEADATREMITKEQARKSIKGSYKAEMLNTIGIYPCLFATIEIEED